MTQPTFAAPWQARVFGMCTALLDTAGLTWDEFRLRYLVPAIEAAPERPYYEQLADAVEALADAQPT